MDNTYSDILCLAADAARTAKAGLFVAATTEQYVYVHGKSALVLYFDGHVDFCDKVPTDSSTDEWKLFWGDNL